MTDNDACAVYFYGEGSKRRLIAHTETCLLREVNPDTLDSMPDKIDMSSVVNILRYARKWNKAERSAKQVQPPTGLVHTVIVEMTVLVEQKPWTTQFYIL